MSEENSKTRVLVTGACGSVGTVLSRRLLQQGHIVCAFDQSEDGLFRLEQDLGVEARGSLRPFLGDVRDESRLRKAMEGVDTVYHCAALKHVYLSEYNPMEAMQTNIVGTNNVIQAAISAQVKKVILTSSDKAVNPSSTMGATKLLGERLFIVANHVIGKHDTRFACVRFGNVLNSNGSVLQIFKRQISNGQPLTITSPNMTRFFISMDQAVDLCLEAADRMIGGEIFVLNMGASDILSLAKAVNGGDNVNYIEIGYKPGEKLYEELVTETEAARTVASGSIYVVLPETIDIMPDAIREKYRLYDDQARLRAPLRSDQDLLDYDAVEELLRSAKLI